MINEQIMADTVSRLLEAGIGGYGVLPDLIGERDEVHLGVLFSIQKTGLLVIQVSDSLVVPVIVKEGFIGADDF